jgi:hypothetical protein
MQRWSDTFILTRALQSTEPKWLQSLRRSTDRSDKRTAPPAPLRLQCHSTEWGWQQPGTASGAIGNSAPPDPGLGLGLSPGRRRTPLRPTQGSDSGSAPKDDELRSARPRARTRAQPWKTTNSAPPDPGLGLGLSPGRRRTPLRPTQGSDSGSAPEDDELRSAQPRARTWDPRARTQPWPQPTVSASPDPGARTRPRPRKTDSTSTSEEPPHRPT